MKIVLDDTSEVAKGVWLTHAAPHELLMLSGTKMPPVGNRSIVMASAVRFDTSSRQLVLDSGKLMLLNLGRTTSTLIVEKEIDPEVADGKPSATTEQHASELGPGDTEFMLLSEDLLKGEAQEAAVDLIRGVRQRWPGDLKKGERNNFSNTPDNYWYVIVQPRVQSLSITIRGEPKRFNSSMLELRVDRPGYTRFSLNNPDHVNEAIRLIGLSKRK